MFYSSHLGSLFGGKSNYDPDLIRYELGACLYIGWIICFFEFALAIAIYFNRGFKVAFFLDLKQEKFSVCSG